MGIETAIFLIIAAGFAGFVDAMAGGGGLIQLPALLIGLSDKPIPLILGTNKVISIFGTTSAATNYFRSVKPDLKLTSYMAVPALIGSAAGARLASSFPSSVFRPLIIFLLISVAIYTWRKPQLGMNENLKFTSRTRHQIVIALGITIGFYDGIFGPGTGSFLMLTLIYLGFAFLSASAIAKVVNVSTNLGAIMVFGFNGQIMWVLGLTMAIGNLAGGFLGARWALKGGSTLIRKVFLGVTTILILRLAYDTFLRG